MNYYIYLSISSITPPLKILNPPLDGSTYTG